MSKLIRLADFKRQKRNIYFNRRELNRLLSLYSRRVACGEWRDFAIDHGPGMASSRFSATARTAVAVAKCSDGLDRRPQFLVLNGQHKLKSGASIDEVLTSSGRALRVA
jgi:hypothetical protein